MSGDQVVIRDLVPHAITTLSTPFRLLGRIEWGGRATIVKLQSGNLAVFSPVAITNSIRSKVAELIADTPTGSVRYLVALNYEHHLFLSEWAKEFPSAIVIGVEGLPEKRELNPETRGLEFQHVFKAGFGQTQISPEFDSEFVYEYFSSHQNKELVFYHKPTQTLIEADLLFNLPATEQFSAVIGRASGGILNRTLGRFFAATNDLKWQKRLLWYGSAAKNRAGFGESIDNIVGFGDVERIIPCHGDVIEGGASQILSSIAEYFKSAA